MQPSQRNKLKQPHRIELPAYDEIGLVLQGGGALGAYQAGVYEGMAEVGVEPTQIAGVSIAWKLRRLVSLLSASSPTPPCAEFCRV